VGRFGSVVRLLQILEICVCVILNSVPWTVAWNAQGGFNNRIVNKELGSEEGDVSLSPGCRSPLVQCPWFRFGWHTEASHADSTVATATWRWLAFSSFKKKNLTYTHHPGCHRQSPTQFVVPLQRHVHVYRIPSSDPPTKRPQPRPERRETSRLPPKSPQCPWNWNPKSPAATSRRKG